MQDENKFEAVLEKAIKLPIVNVNREKFLRSVLKKVCTDEQIEIAIKHNPAYAGVHVSKIDKIAKSEINFVTGKVTAISFVAGFPGGIAMAATVPFDFVQFFVHQLIILQKLIYLYGWSELNIEKELDYGTKSEVTMFVGAIYGVREAGDLITKLAESVAQQIETNVAQKALSKPFYYPIIRGISQAIGVKITKQAFARTVSKVVPVIGAIASGVIAYATFKPMANKLKSHLREQKLSDITCFGKSEKAR